MVLQGNKPDHNYPSTQTELYAVCKIGLTSFRENLADFSNFKGFYDAAWGNLFEQEINDAQALPSPQQRGEPSETANIQLQEKADECLTAWQRLKRHIIDAFPKNLHKPKLEAAGQTLYEKAGKDDWENLQELMDDGEKFITQNLATLTANQNMPPAFQGQFTTLKTEFDTLYDTFTDAEQDAEEETTEKILANNAIHSKLMGMFKDGQEIYRKDRAKKERFIFEKVLELVSGTGGGLPQGEITAVTDQTTPGQVNVDMSGTTGQQVTINWGDTNTTPVTLQGSPAGFAHTYATPGSYAIKIPGSVSAIEVIRFTNDKLTGLTLPDIMNPRSVEISDNHVVVLVIHNTFTNLLFFFASNNDLDQQSVNNSLVTIDGFGTSNGQIFLNGGTNAAPTGAGLTAKANLQGRGWSVNTN